MQTNTTPTLLLLIFGMTAFPFEAKSSDWLESDSLSKSKKKPESEGYWGGISLNKVLMGQFQGNLEDYDAYWGAPTHLGMKLDHVTESWRVELNPFEYRQRFIGEYIAFTTGDLEVFEYIVKETKATFDWMAIIRKTLLEARFHQDPLQELSKRKMNTKIRMLLNAKEKTNFHSEFLVEKIVEHKLGVELFEFFKYSGFEDLDHEFIDPKKDEILFYSE